MLRAVDHRWVRHLTDLDRLREGIGLQAIAQVDPLVAYKREAFAMYQELMNDIRSDIVKTVMTRAGGQGAGPANPDRAQHPDEPARHLAAAHGAQHQQPPQAQRPLLVRQRQEVQDLPHEERR